MNKFKIYFALIFIVFIVFSCSTSSSPDPIAIRDYATQYTNDKATIEDYLKTNYIQSISANQDVTFAKIPEGGTQASVFSLLNSTTFPKLLSKEVVVLNVTYTLYYLKIREDNQDPTSVSPSRVDEVLASYKGSYLEYTSVVTNGVTVITLNETVFETLEFPQQRFGLDRTIRGWAEIFPLFKTGTYDTAPSPNPAVFNNFGAGVMFIPSGLAYFNNSVSIIPAYSPLIFSFKLYDIKRADQDGDGVLSVDEDTNHDGDFTNDDTDGDGKQDYLDIDDDGDGYLTKNEIKKADGTTYLFAAIPDCSGNTTDPNRIKRYLDRNCYKD